MDKIYQFQQSKFKVLYSHL